MTPVATPLLKQTSCPHCWHAFAPHDALWISSHPNLLGDARLGPEHARRFLPSRFDLEGNALDASGRSCHDLACPHCHLTVPRALLEMEPFFVSILGTPACGKSYFLAAVTWELRRQLPQLFRVMFGDADPAANRVLSEYEERLFLNPDPQQLVALADLIRKTELQGELYDTVLFGTQAISYPRPFLFTLQPAPEHPNRAAARRLTRVLALYDNAGEHFLAGSDSTSAPVSHHLPRSKFLLFLFDPTQDPRFLKLLRDEGKTAAAVAGPRSSRQEMVLHEAASRIRRYAGLAPTARHDRPLIVVATKADLWGELLGGGERPAPWVVARDGLAALDGEAVDRHSRSLRTLLLRATSEVVAAAENLSARVSYVAVSALGCRPEPVPVGEGRPPLPGIRPSAIRPQWVTVPFLHGLSQSLAGLIPVLRKPAA
jgi:hypothetical protein